MDDLKFEIPQRVEKLLRRIDEGSNAFQDTQHIRDEFTETCRQRAEVLRNRDTLLCQMASFDESGRSRADEEARRMSQEHERLNSKATIEWEKYKQTTSFIEPIKSELGSFLQCLPPTEPWTGYRGFIEKLDLGKEICWANRSSDSPLYFLKLRLKEISGLWMGASSPRPSKPAAASLKRSSAKSNTERIRIQVMTMWKDAAKQKEKLTAAQICSRLDANNIQLPKTMGWGESNSSWKSALSGKSRRTVSTWLSRAKTDALSD